jgi:hypothetical protein
MFGLTAFYRKNRIFAALPRTRCMDLPNSIALKLEAPSPRIIERARGDPHMHAADTQRECWFSYELYSDSDLRLALEWLSTAYELVRKSR